MRLLSWLFRQTSTKSAGNMTHADARTYLEGQRRDPAASTRAAFPAPMLPSSTAVCPNCGESLGDRAPPSRRSKFKCKKCAAEVHADPRQRLFASVYLTEEQANLVDFLSQLDHWVFTAGSWHDFCWAKQQIGKADQQNTTDVVADAIRFLLNYNREHIAAINSSADAFMQKTYKEDITNLIQEFSSDRKKFRSKRPTRAN